jgi:uncharacterized caspase-like protein
MFRPSTIHRIVAEFEFKSLSQITYTLQGLQKQLRDRRAEEDVRPILRLIDDCFDTMFNELEKVKRAVEDIFNPIEEEDCNVSA